MRKYFMKKEIKSVKYISLFKFVKYFIKKKRLYFQLITYFLRNKHPKIQFFLKKIIFIEPSEPLIQPNLRKLLSIIIAINFTTPNILVQLNNGIKVKFH